MTDQLSLSAAERLVVRSATPEALEVEATYQPSKRPPPPHYHPDQDERIEVLEGELRVRVGKEKHRTLRAGETLEIPRGTVHRMWNASSAPTRVAWRTAPAGRTLEFFKALDGLASSGRVGHNGMPSLQALAPVLLRYEDVFRLAGPRPVVRGVLNLVAAVGRRRGKAAGSGGPMLLGLPLEGGDFFSLAVRALLGVG